MSNPSISFPDALKLATVLVETIREVQGGYRSNENIAFDLANKLQEFIQAQYEIGCDCC